MAKNNQKCVRLSDEVLEIVDNYRGNGFNEKFENLVNDYFNDIPKRKADLERINKLITMKQKQIDEACEKITKAENLAFSLSKLQAIILTTIELCKIFSDVSQSKEIQNLQHEVNEIQPPRKKYKQATKE